MTNLKLQESFSSFRRETAESSGVQNPDHHFSPTLDGIESCCCRCIMLVFHLLNLAKDLGRYPTHLNKTDAPRDGNIRAMIHLKLQPPTVFPLEPHGVHTHLSEVALNDHRRRIFCPRGLHTRLLTPRTGCHFCRISSFLQQ